VAFQKDCPQVVYENVRRELWERRALAQLSGILYDLFSLVDSPSVKLKAGEPARGSGKSLKKGSVLTAVEMQTTVRAKHCQQLFCYV
jgi:hypothetical protein